MDFGIIEKASADYVEGCEVEKHRLRENRSSTYALSSQEGRRWWTAGRRLKLSHELKQTPLEHVYVSSQSKTSKVLRDSINQLN